MHRQTASLRAPSTGIVRPWIWTHLQRLTAILVLLGATLALIGSARRRGLAVIPASELTRLSIDARWTTLRPPSAQHGCSRETFGEPGEGNWGGSTTCRTRAGVVPLVWTFRDQATRNQSSESVDVALDLAGVPGGVRAPDETPCLLHHEFSGVGSFESGRLQHAVVGGAHLIRCEQVGPLHGAPLRGSWRVGLRQRSIPPGWVLVLGVGLVALLLGARELVDRGEPISLPWRHARRQSAGRYALDDGGLVAYADGSDPEEILVCVEARPDAGPFRDDVAARPTRVTTVDDHARSWARARALRAVILALLAAACALAADSVW
jgi:hypothetical protein